MLVYAWNIWKDALESANSCFLSDNWEVRGERQTLLSVLFFSVSVFLEPCIEL